MRISARRIPSVRFLVLLCTALALGPARSAAQSGVLFVRVHGSGDPVSSGTVELLYDGQVLLRRSTDTDGAARLGGFPAGTYDVRVQAIGYRTRTEEGVRVDPGQVRVLEIELETAPVELESISVVVAERVQIQRQNTEFNTTVDEVAIELLPVAYDPKQLIALTPGARPGHVWGGANFQANSYRIDGLSANHPGLGGDLIEPNINWIERLEVRGLGAGAEYGGFQGGLVDVVTKRGHNEFTATIRTGIENDALNASNLVGTEIGTEVTDRYDVEGEVGGPILRDRLYYYVSGKRVERNARALNHLTLFDSRYSPVVQEQSEDKYFGKLTWTPSQASQLELSGGYLDNRADNYGLTGYEDPDGTHRYSSPTWFGNLAWQGDLGPWASVEARLNHFSRDERYEPYNGRDVPGIRRFALQPPFSSYHNAPFTLRSAPSSTSGTVMGTFRLNVAGQEQLLKLGGEHTRGRFVDQRLRNGGMTWMPANSFNFDPADPATWSFSTTSFVPTQWGGEVDLDADVANTALFAQSALSLGSRVVISPGVRWGRWQGWMDPREGSRFLAAQDQAVDPRVGLTVELVGDGSFVLKGHWGRYHQNMIAQMFDRAAGADVFDNEEIWYYRGDAPIDPTDPFTEAERDALADQGLFTKESEVVLNETGPVMDYDQPYVDQWLVGVEKQFGSSVKLEALYTRRTNRDMVALVDLNRATNYVRYKRVRVLDPSGNPIPFAGGNVVLDEVFIPTNVLIERLKYCAANGDVCSDLDLMPPFLGLADSLNLTWDPNYVLTNAPDGRREFGQFQFNIEVARPRWGATFSVAVTGLEGNLDNVSGYADPEEYSAGPYVRVNESVNFYGTLPNFSEREAKVSVWGLLPWKLRGGLFWTYRSGDHYSPRFRLSGMGFYRYEAQTPATEPPGHYGDWAYVPGGENLDFRLLAPLEGHYVFVGPRGRPQLKRRANVDVRLERSFNLGDFDLSASLDVFNLFGVAEATEVNTMVNHGKNYYYFLDPEVQIGTGQYRVPANQYYQAVLDRVPPRTIRLGLTAHF